MTRSPEKCSRDGNTGLKHTSTNTKRLLTRDSKHPALMRSNVQPRDRVTPAIYSVPSLRTFRSFTTKQLPRSMRLLCKRAKSTKRHHSPRVLQIFKSELIDIDPRRLYTHTIDRAINHLATFAGPIIEGIAKATGMHVALLIGGPEPRNGGQLNVIR
jgi:hypothetical protein